MNLFQYILHIDTYLLTFVSNYGNWTYFVLFAVIFCETAFVITPFLPGDSLLFAAGSIAAHVSQPLNFHLLFVSLILASVLGNKINYLIGRILGPRVFFMEQSWLLNKKHLAEAQRFYAKHGGKTIILARFIPIIRTFVPFVAGIGNMQLTTFTFYNILSGFIWIGSLLGAGYFFGTISFIQQHFAIVIYSIIVISLLPPLIAFLYRNYQLILQRKS